MNRSRLAAFATTALALPALIAANPAAADDHDEATYEVTITNTTAGQYLTPPNFAAHSRAVDVFQVGQPASAGVGAVAESGGVPVLAAELAAATDGTSGVGADAPIGPGGSATFSFTTDADRLSIVSMLICTTDGFAGLDSRPLPGKDGQTRTYRLGAFDAGTEINTERDADLVPAPFCGDAEIGNGGPQDELAENGVVRRHKSIRGVGDLPSMYDWNGPVAEVTITRVG